MKAGFFYTFLVAGIKNYSKQYNDPFWLKYGMFVYKPVELRNIVTF